MINRNIKNRGFTLIEMLVAVLLLTTALAGPLTIASKGLTASIVAKDQITAFFLAQDAVEYVRAKRDSNKLAGNSWLAGLENCTSAGGTIACILDSLEQSPVTPSTCGTLLSCTVMRYDTTNNRFCYGSGTCSSSSFPVSIQLRRAIIITTPVGGNANEAAITVNVSWCDLGLVIANCQVGVTGVHTVSVRENILDWQ